MPEALELPTERANLIIRQIPIPPATEPRVVFAEEVAEFEDRLSVDHEGINNLLRTAGSTALVASSIYYNFVSFEQFHDTYDMPDAVAGFCSQRFLADDKGNEKNESDLLSYRNRIVIPIDQTSLSGRGFTALNSTMRHELGHVADGTRSYGHQTLYDYVLSGQVCGVADEKQRVFGLKPTSIGRIARTLGLDELLVLHRLDPGERFANKFDRRHRDFTPVIAL